MFSLVLCFIITGKTECSSEPPGNEVNQDFHFRKLSYIIKIVVCLIAVGFKLYLISSMLSQVIYYAQVHSQSLGVNARQIDQKLNQKKKLLHVYIALLSFDSILLFTVLI